MTAVPPSGISETHRALSSIEADMQDATRVGDSLRCQELFREHEAAVNSVKAAKAPISTSSSITTTTAIGSRAEVEKPVRKRPARTSAPVPEDRLPMVWGEAFRGMPNELIRTGLFNVRRGESRTELKDAVIAATKNTRVLYTGEELRIRDEDVLLQVYHFQRSLPLGQPWTVSGIAFLEAMRWTTGQRGYADLYRSLRRLAQGKVTIVRTGDGPRDLHFEEGALISYLQVDHVEGGSRDIQIIINPQSRALWESVGFTLVDWDQRLSLSSPLARFLHRYYSSHREPYPLKLETLNNLTGSKVGTKTKFRQMLKRTLQDLVDIGFLASFWIDAGDLVHVRRIPRAELS